MADRFVTKDYLLEQFEGYDRNIASQKYGRTITIDSSLSSTSENPVQNKVINTALSQKIATSEKGVNNGVATLDTNGKIPNTQLPSATALTITSVETPVTIASNSFAIEKNGVINCYIDVTITNASYIAPYGTLIEITDVTGNVNKAFRVIAIKTNSTYAINLFDCKFTASTNKIEIGAFDHGVDSGSYLIMFTLMLD